MINYSERPEQLVATRHAVVSRGDGGFNKLRTGGDSGQDKAKRQNVRVRRKKTHATGAWRSEAPMQTSYLRSAKQLLRNPGVWADLEDSNAVSLLLTLHVSTPRPRVNPYLVSSPPYDRHLLAPERIETGQ